MPGINIFYNDFHMKDGKNENKLPQKIQSKSTTAVKAVLNVNLKTEIINT